MSKYFKRMSQLARISTFPAARSTARQSVGYQQPNFAEPEPVSREITSTSSNNRSPRAGTLVDSLLNEEQTSSHHLTPAEALNETALGYEYRTNSNAKDSSGNSGYELTDNDTQNIIGNSTGHQTIRPQAPLSLGTSSSNFTVTASRVVSDKPQLNKALDFSHTENANDAGMRGQQADSLTTETHYPTPSAQLPNPAAQPVSPLSTHSMAQQMRSTDHINASDAAIADELVGQSIPAQSPVHSPEVYPDHVKSREPLTVAPPGPSSNNTRVDVKIGSIKVTTDRDAHQNQQRVIAQPQSARRINGIWSSRRGSARAYLRWS